jgi:uncharacterized membrane protein YhiD involved in acid resistance
MESLSVNEPSGISSLTDLQQFLMETTPTVPVWQFLPSLVVTGLLCWLLGLAYRHWGQSLSNREMFARNFVVLGMTTMLIITIVKSSLALSLGLVGALSIVRFRTAIKEPEELAYLFLTIAIGLGFGANQWLVTTAGFALISVVLWLRHRTATTRESESNLYLTVRATDPAGGTLADITQVLRDGSNGLDLKRFDQADGMLEASYRVSFASFDQLEAAKRALTERDGSISLSFVDNDGIL